MIVEPVAGDLGLQETVVLVAFAVTVKLYVPADGAFLGFPL